ncbi:Synapse-associated protein of 47 kDa [Orchesella cincta]|uniref:Synapse-associated protein of 47 kDa n=1 Tax=Orchesella cincta TaxID=48709 RepID=A0A1D2MRK8_ORCCI|nr:Synapse-associated protein of 47 kDa [Orchesella cincta]
MFGGAKKEEEPTTATEATESTPAPSQEPPAERGRITPDKGSDASSATGGADSDKEVRKTNKVPPEQIPEEDPAAESHAAAGLGKVKSLGMSLFSSIKGAGQKIKDTNILSEFQKEHDSFLKSRGSKGDSALAPWVGHPKEDALKEEILSLSTDRRNFVRSPPSGVAFEWDWEVMAPIAKAILKDDPNLDKMRYELVPKVVSEENFWRNYFYRVTLLKESMSEDESGKKKRDSIDTDEEEIEKELNEELKSFEVVDSSSAKKSEVDEKELDSLLDLK